MVGVRCNLPVQTLVVIRVKGLRVCRIMSRV